MWRKNAQSEAIFFFQNDKLFRRKFICTYVCMVAERAEINSN